MAAAAPEAKEAKGGLRDSPWAKRYTAGTLSPESIRYPAIASRAYKQENEAKLYLSNPEVAFYNTAIPLILRYSNAPAALEFKDVLDVCRRTPGQCDVRRLLALRAAFQAAVAGLPEAQRQNLAALRTGRNARQYWRRRRSGAKNRAFYRALGIPIGLTTAQGCEDANGRIIDIGLGDGAVRCAPKQSLGLGRSVSPGASWFRRQIRADRAVTAADCEARGYEAIYRNDQFSGCRGGGDAYTQDRDARLARRKEIRDSQEYKDALQVYKDELKAERERIRAVARAPLLEAVNAALGGIADVRPVSPERAAELAREQFYDVYSDDVYSDDDEYDGGYSDNEDYDGDEYDHYGRYE